MEITLIATTGQAKGQSIEVRAAKFFIGRHDNCQLRPNILGLGGIHALIEGRDGRHFLRDFGAEGGTGINDRVLHARETEVFDGDLIQIGPMVLTFSRQPKGQAPCHALMNVPESWPYFECDQEPLGLDTLPSIATQPKAARSRSTGESPILARQFPPVTVHEPSHREPAGSSFVVAEAPPITPSPIRLPEMPSKSHGRSAIACRMVDEVMVVSLLSTDLNDEATVSPVRYELRSLLDRDQVAGRMVIDMGNTRYLSSRAVGVLLAHYQGLERIGSAMRVCGVSPEIKPVLDQMRLSMLIDIYPTVEEAVLDPWI